jgi:hypothetical protein
MSIKYFDLAMSLQASLENTSKCVLVCLSMLSDNYGRISNFNIINLAEIVDLGCPTLRAILHDLKRLGLIKMPFENYVELVFSRREHVTN